MLLYYILGVSLLNVYQKKLCDRLQIDFSKACRKLRDFMDDESSHFPKDLAELNAAIGTISITSADA